VKHPRLVDWKRFIEAIRKDPKNFAKAIIDNLNPPKYAVKAIRDFDWICHFCWKPRVDICNWCQRNVCEDHSRISIGLKTKLEWYSCLDCFQTLGATDIMKRVTAEDERFYLEDLQTKKRRQKS